MGARQTVVTGSHSFILAKNCTLVTVYSVYPYNNVNNLSGGENGSSNLMWLNVRRGWIKTGIDVGLWVILHSTVDIVSTVIIDMGLWLNTDMKESKVK